jgi:hypothetical protein
VSARRLLSAAPARRGGLGEPLPGGAPAAGRVLRPWQSFIARRRRLPARPDPCTWRNPSVFWSNGDAPAAHACETTARFGVVEHLDVVGRGTSSTGRWPAEPPLRVSTALALGSRASHSASSRRRSPPGAWAPARRQCRGRASAGSPRIRLGLQHHLLRKARLEPAIVVPDRLRLPRPPEQDCTSTAGSRRQPPAPCATRRRQR